MRSFLLHWLFPRVGKTVLWLLGTSLRWRFVNLDRQQELARRTPIIFAFWHNRLLLTPYLCVKRFRYHRFAVMVSQSKDGQFIAGILERFGITPVRGSTTRGGKAALRELIKVLRSGFHGGFTPDGPKGPRYEVGPGIVVLAQLTGLPILPVCLDASSKIVFNSWDKMIMPMPFSKAVYAVGKPITVDADASSNVLQEKVLELKTALMRLSDRCEVELAGKASCQLEHPTLR